MFKIKIQPPGYHKEIEIECVKTLSGDLMFNSHPEFDIHLDTKNKKIVTVAKQEHGSDAYPIQDEFLDYICKKGAADYTSIKAGYVPNSLGAKLLEPKDDSLNSFDVVIFLIHKYLKENERYINFIENFEDQYEEDLTNPTPEESTELGEVPHKERQGSVPPNKYYGYGYGYRPYVYEGIEKDN